MSDRPLYNSKIINNFVALLKKKHADVDVRELLNYAEISPYELSDEGHWLTQRQVDRFHDKMSYLLGGKELAREGGRYAASEEALGVMAKYTFGFIGPANTLVAIGKCASNFTRSAVYQSRKLADNKVEITVTPHSDVEEKPFQCENRIGFFEAIVQMFDHDIPSVEHPECIFKGGSCCRYIVSWKKTWAGKIRLVRNLQVPVVLVLYGVLHHFYRIGHLGEMLVALAFMQLGASYLAERLEKKEILATLAGVQESTEQMVDQIGVNYNNARMVNEVGQALSTQSGIDEVLQNVIGALEKRLGYDRCLIMLADKNKSCLKFRTGVGINDKQLKALKKASFDLTNPGAKGAFVTCFREQRTMFVDFSEVTHIHSEQSINLSEVLEAQSFICCAIVFEGESLGILAVDNMKTQRPLTQSDMSLLTGLAPVIGMSLRNAMHLERERRMAEQIRQSQKMEAVGVLAGGIAHDFNNLLTGMIGYVSLALMTIKEEDPATKYLDQVVSAADRAADLTQRLLAFSRKQINHPEPVDLNQIVNNVRKLLSRLVTAKIELKVEPSEGMLPVVADSSQIDQMVMNLVTNARDAMPTGGTLTITTEAMELTEEWVESHGYGSIGSYAVLSVTDTGTGMDEATRAHVLEPFFTTKEVGKGSGLGLAIVYGIVKQHEGHLEIYSKPGAGTTLNVYLPLIAPAP
ncbi:sensor histidine kinase, GAF domain-containing [Citrifermentans bemidjiense Bem]|uniref:histidine kinase n=1 Tax=Citrifermentans bemidjiense (strain ATCC BAA-1014 / DSM 16622 / JCM 12645 / Bem) TaxID=404380 RepID=B5EC99_CITBB|nr:ATP-binding protein [Citrifermentans bemidjiense]ACH37527.1 sensor histidine kinase, GAF domain-containing [Citrifermentans bemidjiense Bem]